MEDLFFNYVFSKDFENAKKILKKIKRKAFDSIVNRISEDIDEYYNLYFRLLLVFICSYGKDSDIDYDL